MKHFSHRHPLVLKERQNNYDDNENDNIDLQRIHRCNGCAEPMISGPFYSCDRYNCEFFLHKSCAELPRKIEHPLHPDHSLTLFERPLRSMTCCNGCKKSVHNFIYSCSLCNFVLDILCASITESTITHPSHQHPLTPLRRPVLSMCDACGTEHKGFFYVCSTCNQFWLHRDCASLPKILENTDHHDHPLTLTYCIPPQFSMFVYGCGICPKQVVTYNWAYYCHNCRYFAHLNCATSKSEAFMSILLPGRNIKITIKDEDSYMNVVHLPLHDEFISLISHFRGGKDSEEKKNVRYELNHFSHEHPLVLFDSHVNDKEPCYKGKWCCLNDTKYNDTLCNACLAPILKVPFYKCHDKFCNFVLHKSCAELPTKVRHPCHPQHMLTLQSTKFPNTFWCQGCKFLCNGFKYSCTNYHCKYQLDVVCASLPNIIKHEAHKDHLLCLKANCSYKCDACPFIKDSSVFAFCCETCDFQIHTNCAILPSTIRHRYDETHPFTLRNCPVEDHSDDYYCDICEKELNPLWSFYHCIDCDKSMHAKCVPAFDWRSHIKFGGVLTVKGHEHPLDSVPVTRGYVQCNDYVRKMKIE
ncbi:hypothetical protein LguiB_033440 [Lonicera macranthoides]